MHRKQQFHGIIVTVLCVMAVAAYVSAAHAQQTAPGPPSQFQPVTPPTLDADALKAPKPALKSETAAPKLAPRTSDTPPKLTAPSIGLGKYDLQFEAGKTSDVNPRTGFDSGETSNLSKVTPGRPEGVAPDYFGLKLKVPTNK
jgi:hypothetical protein